MAVETVCVCVCMRTLYPSLGNAMKSCIYVDTSCQETCDNCAYCAFSVPAMLHVVAVLDHQ